jgi:hypothetical protein
MLGPDRGDGLRLTQAEALGILNLLVAAGMVSAACWFPFSVEVCRILTVSLGAKRYTWVEYRG